MVASTIPTVVAEVSFDADLEAAPSTWTWTTLPEVRHVSTKRGKSHRHGRVEAGTMGLVVDNRNRDFDPLNVRGLYYETFAVLDGAAGSYIDRPSPATTITTQQIEIVMRIQADDWTTGAERVLVSHRTASDGWEFNMNASNNFQFQGFIATVLNTQTFTAPSFTDGETYWVKLVIGGNVASAFYWSADDTNDEDDVTWTAGDTGSAVASYDATTATVLRLGSRAYTDTSRFTGHVHKVIVKRAGSDYVYSNFSVGWGRQGTTSMTKADPTDASTWTMRGTATTKGDTRGHTWVLPGRPIRFGLTIGATTYRQFTGFVEEWPNVWPNGPFAEGVGDAAALVGAVDAFKRFSEAKVVSYPSTVHKIGGGPTAYWRFDDLTETFTNSSSSSYEIIEDTSGNEHHLTGALSTAAETPDATYPLLDRVSIVPGLTNTCAKFGVGNPTQLFPQTPTPDIIDGYPVITDYQDWLPHRSNEAFSIIGWIKPDLRGVSSGTHPVGTIAWIAQADRGGSWAGVNLGRILVYVDHATQKLKFLIKSSAGTTYISLTSTTSVATADAIHSAGVMFAVARSSDGYGRLYINGVLEASGRTLAPVNTDVTAIVVGNAFKESTLWSTNSTHYVGELDEMALWSTYEITADEVLDLYNKGVAAFGTNALPGDRVDSLLDVIDWPTAARSLSTGEARLRSLDSTQSVLTSMQEASESEDSMAYMDVNGNVVLTSRRTWREAGSPTYVFGDDPDNATEIPYIDLDLAYSDESIINEAVITQRDSDVELVSRDAISKKRYGLRGFSKQVALASSSDARNLGEEYVRRNKDPYVRAEAIKVKGGTNSAAALACADIEIGDKVTVRRTPSNELNLPGGLDLPGTSGHYATTPDAASLDITGDIDIRVKVALDDWTPNPWQVLVSKGGGAADGYELWMDTASSGKIALQWGTGVAAPFALSTEALGLTNGTVKWVRATLDVDNGAGAYEVEFFTSDDGVIWTQLGTTVTGGSTTSIAANTGLLTFGARSDGTLPVAGTIYVAQVRNGINGPTVADVDFTDPNQGWAVNDTANATGTDNTGKVWTINGASSVIVHPRIIFDAFVIGIEQDIDAKNPADWETTFTLINAEQFQNTWVLGTSALGSTTTLAY